MQQVADGGHDFRRDAEVAEVIENDQFRVRDELGSVMGVDNVDDAIASPCRTVTGHTSAAGTALEAPSLPCLNKAGAKELAYRKTPVFQDARQRAWRLTIRNWS